MTEESIDDLEAYATQEESLQYPYFVTDFESTQSETCNVKFFSVHSGANPSNNNFIATDTVLEN